MSGRTYKTEPDLEQVRRRLFHIAMNGAERESVNAARILLREIEAPVEGADGALLDDIRQALLKEGL